MKGLIYHLYLFTVPFRKKGNLVFIVLTGLSMAASVAGFFSDSTVLVVEKGELPLSPLIRWAIAVCGCCVIYSLIIGKLFYNNLLPPFRKMIKYSCTKHG